MPISGDFPGGGVSMRLVQFGMGSVMRAGTGLKDLMRQMRGCQLCGGLPLGPNPLFQLDNRARILIAGQAPGRITHAKGVPFDDPSGDRLRSWLGVDRATFYGNPQIGIFPMGLCFPGTGKSGDLPPRPECAATWRAPVLERLKQLELVLIIGRYAMEWHLPETRGQALQVVAADWQARWPDQLVLPHPSPRNARWLRQNPWFEATVVPKLQARIAQVLAS